VVDLVEAALSRPRPIVAAASRRDDGKHFRDSENQTAAVFAVNVSPASFHDKPGNSLFRVSASTEDLYTSLDSQIIRRQRFTRCTFSLA